MYEAEHVELGRKLAIKVLAPGHASAPDALDRFRREARAVARLSHPNLVQLYDFGKSLDGRVFLAMELLDGRDARQAPEGLARDGLARGGAASPSTRAARSRRRTRRGSCTAT